MGPIFPLPHTSSWVGIQLINSRSNFLKVNVPETTSQSGTLNYDVFVTCIKGVNRNCMGDGFRLAR